jgi:hypothetical protein
MHRCACKWYPQQPDEESVALQNSNDHRASEDFTTHTRAKTVPIWTSDIDLIKKTAMELFSEFLGRELRLVGVGGFKT